MTEKSSCLVHICFQILKFVTNVAQFENKCATFNQFKKFHFS